MHLGQLLPLYNKEARNEMVATVIKASGKITNPTNDVVITGTILTSDTFTTEGDLYGKSTNVALGGDPLLWRGFSGFRGDSLYAVKDGIAVASNDENLGAVGLDYQISDVAVQFKLAASGSDLTSRSTFFDMRRVEGTSRLYRLTPYGGSKLDLLYRDESNNFSLLGTIDATVNDIILYVVSGSSHKVYVNNILKLDVVHTGYTGLGYISLSRGSTSQFKGTFGIDNLILYKI